MAPAIEKTLWEGKPAIWLPIPIFEKIHLAFWLAGGNNRTIIDYLCRKVLMRPVMTDMLIFEQFPDNLQYFDANVSIEYKCIVTKKEWQWLQDNYESAANMVNSIKPEDVI